MVLRECGVLNALSDAKTDERRPEKPPNGPDLILEDEGVMGHPYASSLGI